MTSICGQSFGYTHYIFSLQNQQNNNAFASNLHGITETLRGNSRAFPALIHLYTHVTTFCSQLPTSLA